MTDMVTGEKSTGDVMASGTGWSLTEDGVLTVSGEYEWMGLGSEEDEGYIYEDDEICGYVSLHSHTRDEWQDHQKEIRKVVLSDDVDKIGAKAFAKCENLENIEIPACVKEIGAKAFDGCTSIDSINIADSVTEIGEWAFNECERLISVSLPESLTKIGYLAFNNCKSLRHIRIPYNVTEIANAAFVGCAALSSVTCLASTPPAVGKNSFDSVSCPLLVPAESVDAYRASGWARWFGDIRAVGER